MFNKIHIYAIKIRRNSLAILFLVFTISILIFSKSNLAAVKSGLLLWTNSVVPSLFPFFVAVELLMHTNIIKISGKFFNIIMKPLFNIRGEGAFAFIMGIISGYPVGAKIASEFRKKNICTKEECERLLSFTNNSGPLFIIGTVGITMFKDTTIGILLLLTHILACITVGILFRFWKSKSISNNFISTDNQYLDNYKNKNTASFVNLGEIISESISNSISTLFIIGGFVVLFSCIISILKTSGILNIISLFFSIFLKFFNIDTSFANGIVTGFLEITNGINIISSIPCKKISINIILTAFFLGFGGISVFLQVLSIVSKTDLSIKPYIYGKLLHGILSAIYTYIFICIFPFLNYNL